MKIMRVLVFALAFAIPSLVFAGGNKQSNYVNSKTVTVTTHTATALTDTTLTPYATAIDIFPNNAYTLWVGSNTTSLQTTGFPVKSSTTYTTDGPFTGTVYGTVDSAAGGDANVRVIYWLSNQLQNR